MPGLAGLDPLAVALAIGIPIVGKIVIVVWSLRGTKPEERPRIIDSIAGLFMATSWQRALRRRTPGRSSRAPSTTVEPSDQRGAASLEPDANAGP